MGNSDTLEVAIHDGTLGGKQYLQATNAIALNAWHHYAATVDSAGNAKLYRDAAELSSGVIGLPRNVTRTRNYIGRSNWSWDDYYEGRMYDVRVYNRGLCPAEIQEIYSSGLFEGVRIIKWVEIQ